MRKRGKFRASLPHCSLSFGFEFFFVEPTPCREFCLDNETIIILAQNQMKTRPGPQRSAQVRHCSVPWYMVFAFAVRHPMDSDEYITRTETNTLTLRCGHYKARPRSACEEV